MLLTEDMQETVQGLVLCETPKPHRLRKRGTISVSGLSLFVQMPDVARVEFPSRSDQEAMQKCVSVAG